MNSQKTSKPRPYRYASSRPAPPQLPDAATVLSSFVLVLRDELEIDSDTVDEIMQLVMERARTIMEAGQ